MEVNREVFKLEKMMSESITEILLEKILLSKDRDK